MDTLGRSTTLGLSHRRGLGYEPLNQASDHAWRRKDGDHGSQRIFSRPRSSHKEQYSPYHSMGDSFGQGTFSRPRSQKQQHRQSPLMMNYSFSYRRNRARQRQIFLQTYKLGSTDSSGKSGVRKLKKFVVKVKTVVVSVLSFMRADTLKSCNSGSAICASSPSRISRFCWSFILSLINHLFGWNDRDVQFSYPAHFQILLVSLEVLFHFFFFLVFRT